MTQNHTAIDPACQDMFSTNVLELPGGSETCSTLHQGVGQWTRQFGASNVDEALAIASDGTSIYVVGGIELGALPGQTLVGGGDAFVRKYDSNGVEQWTRQFGTDSGDEAYGVAVDASGVYVTGKTNGSLGQPAQGFDVFLRKYDVSGNVVWTRQFGGPGTDYGNAVAVNATGVYVAGETTGLPGQTKIGGLFDSFVAKFDLAGAPQWVRQFGGDAEDAAFGVTVNAAGVSVVGFVQNVVPDSPTLAGPMPTFAGTTPTAQKRGLFSLGLTPPIRPTGSPRMASPSTSAGTSALPRRARMLLLPSSPTPRT